MVKERYLINEAAKEVHVESHVLRYWEEELELPIKRNEQGHRIYTQEDVDRFIKIKSLKDQGLQLKAVRMVLEQIQGGQEESMDMRADNPFAQKQLTKIGKNGDMKVIQLKPGDEAKWKEFKSERHMSQQKNERGESSENNEKRENNELAIQIKDTPQKENGSSTQLSANNADTQKEQMVRLQYLFQKLIKEAVAENNEAMVHTLTERITDNLKSDICKELDYQFRLFEEREDERTASKQESDKQRDEEYYKRIDELLRQYSAKKASKSILKKLDKEKDKEKNGSKTKEAEAIKDNTVKFIKEKEKKPKREFSFFKKAVEVK